MLDMDGTLVDSTAAVVAQWGRWAARHNVPLASVLAISHGVPALDTMRVLAPESATQEELDRFMREEEDHEDGVVPVAGAQRFVAQLPPDRWAVVTSAPRMLASMRLAAAGFPQPPVLIASDDVARGKPDPLPYLTAAERLGVAPRDCFAVEDAHAGIASARAAGMTVAGITTTYTREELVCDVIISSFDDLSLEVAGGRLMITVAPAG